jgi:alkylated DNA repair dioxygenase AlkB
VVVWQPSLLDGAPPGFDPDLGGGVGLVRHELSDGAWYDVAEGWVEGADALFTQLADSAPWGEHERYMYDRKVAEPRLTTRAWDDPPDPLPAMARALSDHYGEDLSSISANLYRDGRDSVAWHGDRVGRRRAETVVAIVSLGSPRRFLLRPKGGGPSRRLVPNPGDLLVLGGTCQRTWEHSVPKCASAGPRISIMFRESY